MVGDCPSVDAADYESSPYVSTALPKLDLRATLCVDRHVRLINPDGHPGLRRARLSLFRRDALLRAAADVKAVIDDAPNEDAAEAALAAMIEDQQTRSAELDKVRKASVSALLTRP